MKKLVVIPDQPCADRGPYPVLTEGQSFGGGCIYHPDRPVRVNLDNEDLCQECADEWARGEGAASMEDPQ